MKVCATSLAILPLPLILFQTIDRRGIGITVVEVPNLISDGPVTRIAIFLQCDWHLNWAPPYSILLERENPIPVVLHATKPPADWIVRRETCFELRS